MFRPLFYLALMFSLVSCYDTSYSEPKPEATSPQNASIADLHRMVSPETPQTIQIEEEITVQGVVTTSDKAGNFYHSLVIEEDGHGLEILINATHLHNPYPIGSHLTLKLKGLRMGRIREVITVGITPKDGSNRHIDPLPSIASLRHHLQRDDQLANTPPTPRHKRLRDLLSEDCGALICVENLGLLPDSNEPSTWFGNHTWCDPQGRMIDTYTSQYASFSNDSLPTSRCALTGILSRSSAGHWSLKMRDEADCRIQNEEY